MSSAPRVENELPAQVPVQPGVPETGVSPSASASVPTTSSTPAVRLNNNTKLLLGGVMFSALSVLVTRRSIRRRKLASIPPYYTASVYHRPRVNGALEAFEALNIATVNVLSAGMLIAGGTLYALNVNSVNDMRRLMRGGGGEPDDAVGQAGPRTDEEIEEELQEWLASVLGKRMEKELRLAREKERLKREKERDDKTSSHRDTSG